MLFFRFMVLKTVRSYKSVVRMTFERTTQPARTRLVAGDVSRQPRRLPLAGGLTAGQSRPRPAPIAYPAPGERRAARCRRPKERSLAWLALGKNKNGQTGPIRRFRAKAEPRWVYGPIWVCSWLVPPQE